MPSLTFVMPHWLYWSGLILFPALAAYFAWRQDLLKPKPGQVSLPIAYLLVVTGGFVGLHRFYLRMYYLAFGYIGLFLAILYGNRQASGVRVLVSDARNDLLEGKYDLKRTLKALKGGAEGAAEKVAQLRQAIEGYQDALAETTALWDNWNLFSGAMGGAILVGLLVDAAFLPRFTRRCAEKEAKSGKEFREIRNFRDVAAEDPAALTHSPFTKAIDKLSGFCGNFVCYWSLVAVFVYYYEVVARYVFNSPTNWVHESMFLMFGMQYLLAGSYALREDSHVRVDVIYTYFSVRVKAIVDVVTSVFFFIFTGALVVTGFIFAADSIEVWEVSFTEWAIQYWPVKITLALGGFLLVLQGLAKLIKDITLLKTKEA